MRNVLAMAGKELRGYFASPIGYVLVGFYALLFGWFFYTLVAYFERQSMQMAPGGPGSALNVNQMLVSPLLMNATVIMLLVFPVLIMFGGAIWSAVLGWTLVEDADARAEAPPATE